MSRRAWIVLGAALVAAAWVHRAVACGWNPPEVLMSKVSAHSPMRLADLDELDLEPRCFLDAGLVQEAYRLEELGRMAEALGTYREIERDALAALRYRRAGRFLLHPLDVARTRLRIEGVARGDAAPFLAARRHYEEGRIEEARMALQHGGPVGDEWACLAGVLALPTDPYAAEVQFSRAGDSVRAQWLRARALRMQFEHDSDRAALCRALTLLEGMSWRANLGSLDDDVLCEIGRCQHLLGDDEAAARAYERALADFPHGDMRDEAQESLLGYVYPALAKAGKTGRVPRGVQEYRDALNVKAQLWAEQPPYTEGSRPWFHAAMQDGPAWLKPNAAYRTAACDLLSGQGDSAAALLETVLRLEPDGPYAPLAHYLLANREARFAGWTLPLEWGPYYGARVSWESSQDEAARGAPLEFADHPPRPQGVSQVREAESIRRALEAKEAQERCWRHLSEVAVRFPASEWAPAGLSALVIVAEKLGRQAESVALAARVLRQQPPMSRPPFLRWAARHMKAWVDEGKVGLTDIERAGVLDRYLLESGQPLALLSRCPESPYALRALVLALREVEMDEDRSVNFSPPGRRYVGYDRVEAWAADADAAADAAQRVELARPELLTAAGRVLARPAGCQPDLLGFLHVQLARVRLAVDDNEGALADIVEALRVARDAEWQLWAWETRARAEIALGRLEDARNSVASLAALKPREGVLLTLRGELGRAFELKGDRVGAVRAYREMEYCWDDWFLVAVMCTTDELRTLHEGSPDGSFAWPLWRRLIGEDRWEEARAIERAAKATEDDLATARALEAAWSNLERSRADFESAEKQAEALYQWATVWHRNGLEHHGDLRNLASVVWCLSPRERDAVDAYLERDVPLVRARTLYREVADWFPDTPAAPKALYMVGLSSFEMNQTWAIDWCLPEIPNETARRAYLELAEKYSSSSLADDALYWAGRYTKDRTEQRRLFERVLREHPEGDVARIVFPDGKPELAEECTTAFRERNEALRRKR